MTSEVLSLQFLEDFLKAADEVGMIGWDIPTKLDCLMP
jgi:hypothetical protein